MISPELIARVIEEDLKHGSAQKELGKINYGIGRRLAEQVRSREDFEKRFRKLL